MRPCVHLSALTADRKGSLVHPALQVYTRFADAYAAKDDARKMAVSQKQWDDFIQVLDGGARWACEELCSLKVGGLDFAAEPGAAQLPHPRSECTPCPSNVLLPAALPRPRRRRQLQICNGGVSLHAAVCVCAAARMARHPVSTIAKQCLLPHLLPPSSYKEICSTVGAASNCWPGQVLGCASAGMGKERSNQGEANVLPACPFPPPQYNQQLLKIQGLYVQRAELDGAIWRLQVRGAVPVPGRDCTEGREGLLPAAICMAASSVQ